MVILEDIDFIIEAERHLALDLIFRLVRSIFTSSHAVKRCRRRKALLTAELGDISFDTGRIAESILFTALLILEKEGDAAVYDRLALQDLKEGIERDVDIRKYLSVRLPLLDRTGTLKSCRLLEKSADILAFFEVEVILKAVTEDRNIEILGGILRRAGTETI